MRLANMMNGLAYPPYDNVCYFQSCYGHHAGYGYFRIDSMPYNAVIYLLRGGQLTVIDATRKLKPLSDALKYGVPTWCLVFNRALGKEYRSIKVCDWQTPEMLNVALNSIHKPLVQTIRKLIKIYGYRNPAIIGKNVHLECHQEALFDDKPEMLKNHIGIENGNII
jgi:hypothetical protein